MFKVIVAVFLLLSSVGAISEERDMSRWTRNVHAPIVHYAEAKSELRLAILNGMIKTKGASWYLENEGDDFISARLDWRGGVILVKVVYDQEQVQIKYQAATEKYRCKSLQGGICYKGVRPYFNYTKNLRASILRAMKLRGMA